MAKHVEEAAAPARGLTVLPEWTAADPRSDDGERIIRLGARGVTIDRRVNGMAMRIRIPYACFGGVCVGVEFGAAGGFVYTLTLMHDDEDLGIVLCRTADEAAVWTEWQAWSELLGLPRFIERNDGPELYGVSARPGQAPAGPRRPRRRRRPGIVARRQVRPEALSSIYREAELIARH